MEVQAMMTQAAACCLPEATLKEAAQAMVNQDCGAIPVVENNQSMRLLGIITDRDIVVRSVAEGKNPMEMKIQECLSTPVVTVTPQTSLEDCCKVMEEHQVRRVPVVDAQGACCGIVTQAQVARHAADPLIARLLRRISRPPHDDSASPAELVRPARRNQSVI